MSETHGLPSNKPPIDKTEAELEAEADRILRDAGSLKEHGILSHPDNRGARHEWRVSDGDFLDFQANAPRDRRSSRQKAMIVQEDADQYGKRRKVKSTDSSQTGR